MPSQALQEVGFREDESTSVKIYKGRGCSNCNNTGYRGRVGLFEVMPVSEAMGKLIMEGGNAIQIRDLALSEGLQELRASGRAKVKAGVTSLEEINRVTKD